MSLTEADLKERARVLVTTMMEVGRVAYVIPSTTTRAELEAAIAAAGLAHLETDEETDVTRFHAGDDVLVLLDREDLGVRIFELRGKGAVTKAGIILSRVPFVPQTNLLRAAIDVASPDAGKALFVLAHTVVAWDDDWTDLFLLHLASPDPIARNNAVTCTFLAAMCAGVTTAAIALLKEAARREKFPKLKETMEDALGRLGADGH